MIAPFKVFDGGGVWDDGWTESRRAMIGWSAMFMEQDIFDFVKYEDVSFKCEFLNYS